MKQEDKAKAYDKVRKKIAIRFGSNVADEFFAEFEESEDEKVRKEIINYFQCQSEEEPTRKGIHDKWIAWLENIPVTIDHEKREGFHLGYKAGLEKQGHEPKWCHHKVDLSNCSEEYRKAYYDGWNNCNMQHSQCESEKSDVLKCLINGMKFYYEDNEEATWGTQKFSMKVKDILSWLEKQGDYANFRDKAQVGDRITKNEDGVLVNLSQLKRVAKPSEKQGEQKFEMKTAEESLGIDSDTYNKVVDECLFGEHKPEENKGNIGGISANWSGEDEAVLDALIRRLEGEDIHVSPHLAAKCLKSLKDRVQPKQEWSNVDKDILFRTINDLKFLRDTISIDPKYAVNIIDMEREITWLESLRPQNRWKPSELQLGCLSDAIEYYNSLGYPASKLKELLDDLKKLKEGEV